jgi:hypothetical protein
MPQKTKKKAPDLFEYKISFRFDEEATMSQRHYLAHNARDALGMFAYAMLRNLFDRKTYFNQEFIISKEFVRFHDRSLQSPRFQLEKDGDSSETKNREPAQKQTTKITTDSVTQVVEAMNTRIEILKFEEFNRWANRWYSLKLPLEEITTEEIAEEVI